MLVRTNKLQMTIEELDTILTRRTEDGTINTVPEAFDFINRGGGVAEVISDEDIDNICK